VKCSMAFLSALVKAHPPPRLHHGSLHRCVSVLQPEPECAVIRVCEVRVGIAYEVANVRCDLGQVAGGFLGYVSVVAEARPIPKVAASTFKAVLLAGCPSLRA
jgi:hypothetical protein